MRDVELEGVLEFLRGAEQLKNTLRSSRTSNGRHESTAEHTWRLCLMVLLFDRQYPDIDILKLLKICVIHDLGEAINGDIAAVDQVEGGHKGAEERKDLELIRIQSYWRKAIIPFNKRLHGDRISAASPQAVAEQGR